MTVSKDSIHPGIMLSATYKHATYTCSTYETGGKIRFQLPDGRDFKSISGAAGAITNIPTQNGWAFWSVASPDALGATDSHTTTIMVVDPTIKINGRTQPPGGVINKKVIIKDRKPKRTNTRKPKNWDIIEDEYLRGAEQVLAITALENKNAVEDYVEDFDESTFKVTCMICNKDFPDSVKASDHFIKKH